MGRRTDFIDISEHSAQWIGSPLGGGDDTEGAAKIGGPMRFPHVRAALVAVGSWRETADISSFLARWIRPRVKPGVTAEGGATKTAKPTVEAG